VVEVAEAEAATMTIAVAVGLADLAAEVRGAEARVETGEAGV